MSELALRPNFLAIRHSIQKLGGIEARVTIREHFPASSLGRRHWRRYQKTLRGKVELINGWLYIKLPGMRGEDDGTEIDFLKELEATIIIELLGDDVSSHEYQDDMTIAIYRGRNYYAIEPLDTSTLYNRLMKVACKN